MAPEIASWDSENSPGRPEAHPGQALALPAPRKAPGSVRAAADRTPPARAPVAQLFRFHAKPTSPQNSTKGSSTRVPPYSRPRQLRPPLKAAPRAQKKGGGLVRGAGP